MWLIPELIWLVELLTVSKYRIYVIIACFLPEACYYMAGCYHFQALAGQTAGLHCIVSSHLGSSQGYVDWPIAENALAHTVV